MKKLDKNCSFQDLVDAVNETRLMLEIKINADDALHRLQQTPKEPDRKLCHICKMPEPHHDEFCSAGFCIHKLPEKEPECKPLVCKHGKVIGCWECAQKPTKPDELAERLARALNKNREAVLAIFELEPVADEARRWALEQFQGVEHHTIAEELWRLKGE